MRTLRPALGLALVATAALSLSASAAPSTAQVLTDQAGDANGLHDQGQGMSTGTATPGSQAGKDVLSVTLTPTTTSTAVVKNKKKATTTTCTGYTAVLELSAPPTSNTVYRILGTTAKNTSLFWLQHDNNPVGGTTTSLRHSDGTSVTTPIAPAKIDGNKIVFTVAGKDLKAAGEKLATLKVQGLGADVRSSTGVVTAPSWDVIPEDDAKSFSPCG